MPARLSAFARFFAGLSFERYFTCLQSTIRVFAQDETYRITDKGFSSAIIKFRNVHKNIRHRFTHLSKAKASFVIPCNQLPMYFVQSRTGKMSKFKQI